MKNIFRFSQLYSALFANSNIFGQHLFIHTFPFNIITILTLLYLSIFVIKYCVIMSIIFSSVVIIISLYSPIYIHFISSKIFPFYPYPMPFILFMRFHNIAHINTIFICVFIVVISVRNVSEKHIVTYLIQLREQHQQNMLLVHKLQIVGFVKFLPL